MIDAEKIEGLQLTVAGEIVRIDDISEALKKLELPVFLQAIQHIIMQGGGEQLKLLVDSLEIQMTSSAFSEEKADQLPTLEKAAQDFPFSVWLEQMGISLTEAKREHIIAWWETFMLMVGERGYISGQINKVNRKTNLWKATSKLALKMQSDPAAYGFLPALLINHPTEVDRVLNTLTEAIPFMEVLTGESIEDMRESNAFLGAFCTVKRDDKLDHSPENAILSIALALQRG